MKPVAQGVVLEEGRANQNNLSTALIVNLQTILTATRKEETILWVVLLLLSL
jgi:hypothetical protein